jgi:hypothetical protein
MSGRVGYFVGCDPQFQLCPFVPISRDAIIKEKTTIRYKKKEENFSRRHRRGGRRGRGEQRNDLSTLRPERTFLSVIFSLLCVFCAFAVK